MDGSVRDKLGFAVKRAVLATEARTRHPVEFRVGDRFVELVARSESVARVFDPEERETMIYCGGVLQHLKLALKRYDCFGRVDLFPDLDQPHLAARVYLGGGGARDDWERQLFSDREVATERLKRLPTPISEATLEWLGCALMNERGWLEYARSDGNRQRLAKLVQAAGGRRANVEFQNEEPMRPPESTWRIGRFTSGLWQERLSRWRKPPAMRTHTAVVPVRTQFTLDESGLSEDVFAVLKTKTDDKHGWLAAGQTLARLLLHAQMLGLPCTPFVDVLRRPELRAELRTAIGHKGFTQVILRFVGPHIDLPAAADVTRSTIARGSA